MAFCWPTREFEREWPASDSGEEMTLDIPGKIIWLDIDNGAFIDKALGNFPCVDQLPQPRCGPGIVLVVIVHSPFSPVVPLVVVGFEKAVDAVNDGVVGFDSARETWPIEIHGSELLCLLSTFVELALALTPAAQLPKSGDFHAPNLRLQSESIMPHLEHVTDPT
jgi:hypothetical protein